MKKMIILVLGITSILNAADLAELKVKLAEKNVPDIDFSAATDKISMDAANYEREHARVLYQQALQAINSQDTSRALSALKQIVEDETLVQGAKDAGIYDNIVSRLEQLLA